MGEPATVQIVRSRGNESRLTFTCGVLTPFVAVAVFDESALDFEASLLLPEESAVVPEPVEEAPLSALPLAVSVLVSVLAVLLSAVLFLSAEAVFCPDCEQPESSPTTQSVESNATEVLLKTIFSSVQLDFAA